MADSRRLRLLSRATEGGADFDTKRLCDVCVEVTGTTGAGIMLMSDDIAHGSLCTTDGVSALIEELQFALGEGPCIDAYQERRSVAETDLANPVAPRWLAFAGAALDAGVRAVFGFPLRVGHVRLGAVDLYRDRPGALTEEEHVDMSTMADLATRAILMIQAHAPPGRVAAELEQGADFHYVVNQACGMIAAGLNASVGQPLIRLRALAFGDDRPLSAVAEDVVARRLRFNDDRFDTDRAS